MYAYLHASPLRWQLLEFELRRQSAVSSVPHYLPPKPAQHEEPREAMQNTSKGSQGMSKAVLCSTTSYVLGKSSLRG